MWNRPRTPVSKLAEGTMDLWHALGITPQQGLVFAGVVFAAALVLAGSVFVRRTRAERRSGLGLDER